MDSHCHYVQGVAWDPLAKYVASLSSDRTCRIYVNKPHTKTKGMEKMNYVCQHVITKAEQPTEDASKVRKLHMIHHFMYFMYVVTCYKSYKWFLMQSVKNHLFHDETLPSFFRRLAWSPDGSFLLVPAGIELNVLSNLLWTNVVQYSFSGCWLPKNS